MRSGTEKEINAEINEIKKSNRNKYLYIEKFMDPDGYRTRDILSFSIISKNYFENTGTYPKDNLNKKVCELNWMI